MTPADPRFLGAQVTEAGTNFALWAAAASRVELCLFDEALNETRHELVHRDGPIFHGYFAGIEEGQKYGYRVYGPWDPERGWRFNPNKLLIDPYAHLLAGEVSHVPEIYGHQVSEHSQDLNLQDQRDSKGFVPYSVVTRNYPLESIRLNTAWPKTVIYEAHVKGLTQFNPDIPQEERGTYKALAHPSTINYLKDLGITALELLPIHHFLTEPYVAARDRINHWGYNPIAFSAPHRAYAATEDPIEELKNSVKALHEAGIEVLLDVVYNHTAEGGLDGPTLSFRGIDSKTFYRRSASDVYEDVTGCGNTIDARRPYVVRMIVDSLRWWSEVIGIDGFRFDLAAALARSHSGIDGISALVVAIASDPVLRERKLIAEPWDVSGYALGVFPHPWREWNDQYRDTLRKFWLFNPSNNIEEGVGALATRLSGSHDTFYYRGPTSSINFITAHDGFTLADAVSFENKNNLANGEENRDGTNDNYSWNLGHEGPSRDLDLNQLRLRLQKSMLASLLLSAGIPMITMGDEVGRSQSGSNNSYTLPKDASLSDLQGPEAFYGGWALNWELSEKQKDLFQTTKNLISIRDKYLVDVTREFFTGELDLNTSRKDLAWFCRSGTEMNEENWGDKDRRYLSKYVEATSNQGLLILLNAAQEQNEFVLPSSKYGLSFRSVFDSSKKVADYHPVIQEPESKTLLEPHTLQVWLANRASE